MRTWICDRAEQWMQGRFAPSQGVEANLLTGEVDLAAHHAMGPMLGDGEGAPKQIDLAALIAAAQEDHGAIQRRSRSKAKRAGKSRRLGAPSRRMAVLA